MTNIQKTEVFLKEQLVGCAYFKEHPADGEYRLQHSYRVAHAAREIARREGLDEEGLVIGGLLHDVGYSLNVVNLREIYILLKYLENQIVNMHKLHDLKSSLCQLTDVVKNVARLLNTFFRRRTYEQPFYLSENNQRHWTAYFFTGFSGVLPSGKTLYTQA